MDSKNITDPYKLLNSEISFLEGTEPEKLEQYMESQFSNIDEGGEAMMAYHYLQFPDIHQSERKVIENSLLKYCELDTLAMVMIYEYFKDVLTNTSNLRSCNKN